MRPLSISEVLGPRGLLAEVVPGWESRPPQLEMAASVAAALRESRPLVVEAGTGTGKTLAYLVPALLSGMKVVVSTGTKNLQEQILKKDIPLLSATLPFSFQAVALKGIANYLCRRRFLEFSGQAALGLGGEMGRGGGALLDRLREWAEETESGDRGELAELPDDTPLWREVSATSETRLGSECPHFESCFVTRARRLALAADLVVVNHHLFFADLAVRAAWPQAQILPPYEAVIFDEAHQLEDVATDYFSVTVSTLRVMGLVRDVRRALGSGHVAARLEGAVRHIEQLGDLLFAGLRMRLPREGRVILGPETWRGQPTRDWHAIDTGLEELASALGAEHPESQEARETCEGLARRAHSLRDDLAFIADQGARDRVYWGEVRGRTVLLHASPIDVSEIMREQVVRPIAAVVFTSATLATGGARSSPAQGPQGAPGGWRGAAPEKAAGGEFDYVRSRLGLEEADELRLASPFDYAQQALLYLPRDLPEPSSADFTAAAAERMLELVRASRGRAFLLFTSHRQMSAVAGILAGRIEHPVLIQGERPKHQLLDEFRRQPSVLLATASFWEGVDVVGEALELVVIDKLPFAPPDDPIVAARCRRLTESGRDAFAGYQVPEAALALAQGFGRLIRHRRDRGVVALLDRRAVTRAYGRLVLSSLPPECPRTSDLGEVQRFFAMLRALRAQREASA
ncbi:MAG TPA: ATP-dependent DNA helicase [Polyangia bacterium]|jgi:ATP-dependent DNA helicase DinG|nr:ATP-dependent DNA helicase [Polyangia bacterium]